MSALSRVPPPGIPASSLGARRVRRSLPKTRRALLGAFGATGAVVLYWSVARGRDLLRVPTNPRGVPLRGRILARDRTPLAWSERHERYGFVRRYSTRSLAQVIGYTGGIGAGVEAAYNDELTAPHGGSQASFVSLIPTDRPNDVVLGIDIGLQRATAEAFTGSGRMTPGRRERRGAVLVLDLSNREIRASVSVPDYAPDPFVDPRGGIAEAARRLGEDPGEPLVNRPAERLYRPGCIFGPVVAIALLEADLDPSERITIPAELRTDPWWSGPYGPPVSSSAGFDLNLAVRRLARGYFVMQALRLGPDVIEQTARQLGLARMPDFDLPASAGQLSTTGQMTTAKLLADTARGQGDLLVSLLQMVEIFSAIARGGSAVGVHYGSALVDADGRLVRDLGTARAAKKTGPPTAGVRLMSRETAATIRARLSETVRASDGAARGAQRSDVQIAGLAGPADSPLGPPHAWFIGFAPADAPRFLAGVVIEHAEASDDPAALGAEVLAYAIRSVARGERRPVPVGV